MNSSNPSEDTLRKMYQDFTGSETTQASFTNDSEINADNSFEHFLYYLFVATDINPINGIDTFDMEFEVPQLNDFGRDVFEHVYYEDTGLPDTCTNTVVFFDRRLADDYLVVVKTKQHLQDLLDILTYVIENGDFNPSSSANSGAYATRDYIYRKALGLEDGE